MLELFAQHGRVRHPFARCAQCRALLGGGHPGVVVCVCIYSSGTRRGGGLLSCGGGLLRGARALLGGIALPRIGLGI